MAPPGKVRLTTKIRRRQLVKLLLSALSQALTKWDSRMQTPDYKEQQRQDKEAFKKKRIAAVSRELAAAGVRYRQGSEPNHFIFDLPYGKAETWATTGTWVITDESLSITMDHTRQKGHGVQSLIQATWRSPSQLAFKVAEILRVRGAADSYEARREANAAYPWIAKCINAGADLALLAKLSGEKLKGKKTLLHILARADRDALNPKYIDDTIEAFKKLLAARGEDGALLFDLNAKDADLGFTPLHYAIENSTKSLIRFLLEAGADPHVKSDTAKCWTPYQCAQDWKYDDVLQMMDSLRAKAAIQAVLDAIPAPAGQAL
jgi:hypothetical protein